MTEHKSVEGWINAVDPTPTHHAPNLPKDTTELPQIGRLIHVRGYDKCRAAIVTGKSSEQVSGYPKRVFLTIFPPNLKPQEAVLTSFRDGWHYVNECTF